MRVRGPASGEARTGYALLLPSLAAVAAVSLFPVLAVLWLSLHQSMPVFGIHRFAGLDNYAFLLRDPRFARSLANTTYVMAVSVALEVVLGLAIALLVHRPFRGRGLVRAAVLVPWAIPTVVSARMWEWILNPDFGVLNHLLGARVHWLGDPLLAIHSVILVDAWKTAPFAALLLLAGLAAIPDELYQAARVDGAGAWRSFVHVTLPLLRPFLLVAILFRSLDAFRIFDVVYVLTGGGPANTTETLSVYAYKLYFQTLEFGYGSAVSVVVFLCVMALSVAYLKLLARRS